MIGMANNSIAALLAQQQFPQMQQQQQAAPEPFQWGAGGQRMTPEAIARQREIAAGKMAVDVSPIGSWTQGLGRVLNNVTGALQDRQAVKAEQSNQEYSSALMGQLNGTGNAGDAPGVSSSSAPGASERVAMALQVASDPYASEPVRAQANRILEQSQWEQRKQMEWQNREMPEIVQLANIENDENQPLHVRQAARDRRISINDPTMVIPGPNGTYVGPRSGMGAAFGEAPVMGGGSPAPGTVVADPRGQPGKPSLPPSSGRSPDGQPQLISRQDFERIMVPAKGGRRAAEQWARNSNVQVVD